MKKRRGRLKGRKVRAAAMDEEDSASSERGRSIRSAAEKESAQKREKKSKEKRPFYQIEVGSGTSLQNCTFHSDRRQSSEHITLKCIGIGAQFHQQLTHSAGRK